MKNTQLTNIKRSSLSESIAAQLEQLIKEGRFIPGEKLPSERSLSKELGVSRPVVREALILLAARNFVDTQHGRGTFVTAHSVEILSSKPIDWLTANSGIVESFYEARLAIEPTCAALASQRASEEQITALQTLLDKAEQIVEDGGVLAFIGLDIDFHAAIAEMSDNKYLFRMLESIIHPETDLRNVLHRLPKHLSVAHERHKQIVNTIAAGDAEAARQAMMDALQGPASDIKALAAHKERE